MYKHAKRIMAIRERDARDVHAVANPCLWVSFGCRCVFICIDSNGIENFLIKSFMNKAEQLLFVSIWLMDIYPEISLTIFFLAIVWIALLPFIYKLLFKRLAARLESRVVFVIAKIVFFGGMLLLPVTIMAITTIMIYEDYRNYLGYCTEKTPGLYQKPYIGRQIDTRERLNIAVNNYLVHQEKYDIHEIMASENMNSLEYKEYAKTDFSIIPYNTFEEFVLENSSCCELTWYLPPTGEKADYATRASGRGNGYFTFNHKVRYVDGKGIQKSIITKNFYYVVTNCGTAYAISYGSQ
jgi:hypothetical protein